MSKACKKLVNTVEKCVDENLEGLVAVNPGLRLLEGHRVVVREDIEDAISNGKVSVICGGGSGHEPAHAGFVGHGMLSASVAGAVFASPPPQSILACLRAVSKKNAAGCVMVVTNYTGDRLNFGLALERATQEHLKVEMVIVSEDCAVTSSDKTAGRRGLVGGTVVIIKNYTGDRINFGLAVERAKAEGYKAEMVVVAEDCALKSSDKTAGRRGLCGTILIEKICGALAEEGRSLDEIVKIAKDATKKMGTIGLSLSPCTIPGAGATFTLAEDEMELGLGIHGEAGVKRTKLVSAKEAVKMMIDHMTDPNNNSRLDVKSGDKVACMINNLGGTSVLELNIIAREAILLLESRGVSVERVYCGPFTTSLEMAGISITLLHLDDTLRNCLDAETSAPGWFRPYLPKGQRTRITPSRMKTEDSAESLQSKEIHVVANTVSADVSKKIYDMVKTAAERLVSSEEKLNGLDKESGDGDCGSTMARGAHEMLLCLGSIENPSLPVGNPAELAKRLGSIAEMIMGGSSGGLYSLFFTAVSGELQKDVTPTGWSRALSAGVAAIRRYGGADPGDRTMLDALFPASEEFSSGLKQQSPTEAFRKAVQKSIEGADSTATMKARAGRSSYVSQDRLTNPDPGAIAVTIWLSAVLDVLTK